MVDRPGYRELDGKLRAAREAIEKQAFSLLAPDVILEDAFELNYMVADLPDKFLDVLAEATPDHYKGQHPPARSYSEEIINAELFAFKVDSACMGCKIYLKFAIIESHLYIVSFHKDRT